MNIGENGKLLKIICKKTLGKKMNDQCKNDLGKIKKELERDAQYVCTTADIWTNKVRRALGVTAHWV